MRRIVMCVATAVCLVNAASAQDPAEGEKVFATCKACHQIGEGAKNAIGPELNGVVGRKAGSVAGYSYSDANKNSGITWDESNLAEPGNRRILIGKGQRHADAADGSIDPAWPIVADAQHRLSRPTKAKGEAHDDPAYILVSWSGL
jgi:cytochrome c